MSLKWYGPQVQAAIRAEMKRRIFAACTLVLNRARELLSVAGPEPSSPGEPPHKQTGHLRRSVAREVVDLVGRVGTNLKYGRWLELGTRMMAARPWLRRALDECRDQVKAILSKPMP